MASEHDSVPVQGQWPVDPQEDCPISEDRIWVDGCFDFAHHGHAGAMLQARRLGKELVVGIHTDEDILSNKGPTVMNLKERVAAVDACRWSTKSVPCAPYVTSLPWISHYGCFYVVHGDDITSDANGEDCYRYVKAAGRFLVVKRTPSISTTDLVGRMLLCTKGHFIRSLPAVLAGHEGSRDPEERKHMGLEMMKRIEDYAKDETGLKPYCKVYRYSDSAEPGRAMMSLSNTAFDLIVDGQGPEPGQRIVYVDGGFDLFSSGHIEFLRQVAIREAAINRHAGSSDRSRAVPPAAYVVAGVHDDAVINRSKGVNYPIMNVFERGLCVLQCRYINSVVFSAPFSPSLVYLSGLPFGRPDAVYHGPTSFMPTTFDPYTEVKQAGIFNEIGSHDFDSVNAEEIVQRIVNSRASYEARQRAKGEKAVAEEAIID